MASLVQGAKYAVSKPAGITTIGPAKNVTLTNTGMIGPPKRILNGINLTTPNVSTMSPKPTSVTVTNSKIISAKTPITENANRAVADSKKGPVTKPVRKANIPLNQECLSCIFSYLSLEDRLRAASVCRLWKIVAMNDDLVCFL